MNSLTFTTTNQEAQDWDNAARLAQKLQLGLEEELRGTAPDAEPERFPLLIAHTAARGRVAVSLPRPTDLDQHGFARTMRDLDTRAAATCHLAWGLVIEAEQSGHTSVREPAEVALVAAVDRSGARVARCGHIERSPGQRPHVRGWEDFPFAMVMGDATYHLALVNSVGPPQ